MALQGLLITNNFMQTKTQFNELMNYMNNTLKIPLSLNLNIGVIQQQLKEVAIQTEQLKSNMNLNMNVGGNTGGLDKMVTTTRAVKDEVTGLNREISTIEGKVVKVSSSMGQTIQTTERFNRALKDGVLIEEKLGGTVTKTTENYKAQLAVKEKSIAMGESALVQRENELLTEATGLMTKKLNLEQQIKVANENGNIPLQEALALREKEISLQSQSANSNLSNASEATKSTLLQREIDLKESIVIQNAKIEGQGKLETAEVERRILLYQKEKAMQVSGIQQKYGSSVNTADLERATLAYRQLGAVGITSLSELNAKEQQVNMSLKEITAQAKASALALAESTGKSNAFLGSFGKMIPMMAGMAVVMGVITGIKDGIGSVIEMNSTLATLSITMNGTKKDFQEITKEIQNTAIATGSDVKSVEEATKVYANMGEPASSIMAKTKSAIMLSNVTGLDTTQTTDSIKCEWR